MTSTNEIFFSLTGVKSSIVFLPFLREIYIPAFLYGAENSMVVCALARSLFEKVPLRRQFFKAWLSDIEKAKLYHAVRRVRHAAASRGRAAVHVPELSCQ